MFAHYRTLFLVALPCLLVSATAHGQKLPAVPAKPLTVNSATSPAKAKAQRLTQLNKQLFAATKVGDVARMEALIKLGANINARDERSQPPIFLAIYANSLPAVHLLINYNANVNISVDPLWVELDEKDDLNDITNYINDITPLDYAAYFNRVDMVKTLMAAGAKSRANDDGASQIYVIAAHRNALETMRMLLDRDTGQTKVRNASSGMMVAIYSNHTEMVKLLIDAGADAASSNQALLWIIDRGSPEIAFMLLNGKADPKIKVDYKDSLLITQLHRQLPQDFNDDLSPRKQLVELIETLLARGADPNEIANDGHTPLLLAIEAGNVEFVRALLNAGAKVNLAYQPFCLPLRALARSGYDYGLDYTLLIEDKNLPEDSIWNEKWKIKQSERQITIAHLLVEHGANPKQGDSRLALGEAVMLGKSSMVQFLLDNGADPNQPLNPVPYLMNGDRAVDARIKTSTPMSRTLLIGNELTESGPAQIRPLHLAAKRGNLEIVQQLLTAGADVKATDNLQNNALHYLAGARSVSFDLGANPLVMFRDEMTNSSPTPINSLSMLSKTLVKRKLPILEALIAAGCPTSSKNMKGQTPLQMAAMHSDVTLFNALLKANAKLLNNNLIFDVIQGGRRQGYASPAIKSLQYDLIECDYEDMRRGNRTGAAPKNKKDILEAKNRRTSALSNRTLLLKLCSEQDIKIVQRLLANGISLEARNSMGLTPLMLAARLGQREMVATLINAGANRKATSRGGESIATQVEKYGQATFKELPLKEESPRSKKVVQWLAAEAIKNRESLIRYTLKREDAEIIKLLQNSKSPVLRTK